MVAGGLVLAYAVFQLWGTGVAEARAQDELAERFEQARSSAASAEMPRQAPASVRAAADGPVPAVERRPTLAAGAAAPGPDPDLAAVQAVLAGIDRAAPPVRVVEPGEPVGVIAIPAIDLHKTIVSGTSRDDLRAGPGHYRSTPLPGQPGNVAIAGHRTTHGAPFHDLDLLVPGDEIVVETLDGTFTYLVEGFEHATGSMLGHRIVDPSQVEVIADQGDNRLTLTACHPKYSARERIIVTATLRAEPEPAIDRDQPTTRRELPLRSDEELVAGPSVAAPAPHRLAATPVGGSDPIEESLGWQPAYTGPTAMWAVLTALIAAAGWGLGRLWRRFPAYAMAVPPFGLALFTCFENLERLLPAV